MKMSNENLSFIRMYMIRYVSFLLLYPGDRIHERGRRGIKSTWNETAAAKQYAGNINDIMDSH